MELGRCVLIMAMLCPLAAASLAADTRRDVFVDPHAQPGGDGAREAPYASIQEAVERHESDWGQVFLQPGVYREDVDIHRGRFWFFPAQQYGVELEGSITVRRPGTKIRGLVIRSEGSGIVLAEGASGCEIQHCRITAIGEGGAGIEIAGPNVSGCLINGNVIELTEREGRTGIRVRVSEGVAGNHLDHNKIAGCDTGIAVLDEGGTADGLNTVTTNRIDDCEEGIVAPASGVRSAWNEIDGQPGPGMDGTAVAGGEPPRTIHVAPGDEAAGRGTEGEPFTRVALAVDVARPGDTVLLAPGEYREDLTISTTGAPDAPITIRAEKPGEVILRESGWRLEYASHVRIEGIDFADPQGAALVLGPYARHCEFVSNRITREAEGGGTGVSVSGPAASHNLFEGNTITLNHGGVGLQVNCQRYNWHLTIRGNDISGCYYGIQTGGGSYPTAPPGYHVIEGNELHHNWKDGFHSKTTDNIFRSNHVHHNGSCGVTTRYGSRNVFVGNRIHDNGGGMRIHSKSHFIINNVIYSNRRDGIYLGSWPSGKEGEYPFNFEPFYEPPHEVWIAHNTIVSNGGSPIFADSGSQVMALRNILVGKGESEPGIRFGPGGVARQVEQNLYWNARPPLLREYEGGEYERVADPMFVDPEHGDFRVAEGSPARDVVRLGDALSFVLSPTPAGVELGQRIGANLGPPPG